MWLLPTDFTPSLLSTNTLSYSFWTNSCRFTMNNRVTYIGHFVFLMASTYDGATLYYLCIQLSHNFCHVRVYSDIIFFEGSGKANLYTRFGADSFWTQYTYIRLHLSRLLLTDFIPFYSVYPPSISGSRGKIKSWWFGPEYLKPLLSLFTCSCLTLSYNH